MQWNANEEFELKRGTILTRGPE